jgi:hypothetical protein
MFFSDLTRLFHFTASPLGEVTLLSLFGREEREKRGQELRY